MVDVSKLTEWDFEWRRRVEKLNSAPEFQMFEVGPRGTLVAGDILFSKGEDDEFEATIEGVKPGIWTITEKPKEGDDFKELLLRWVAPGPLDFDNLPTNLPKPSLSPLTKWTNAGEYSVDSGSHGIFDLDSLENLIQSHEDQDKEYILETIADFCGFEDRTSVQVGLVVGGDDGGYRLMAREHEGRKVQILLQRNWEDEEGEDNGEDAEVKD